MTAAPAIITINTWKGEGDYATRIVLLAEQLALLDPSVVFLQEAFVCESAGVDTAQALARALQMQAAVVLARRKPRLFCGAMRDSSSNLAILSREPFRESRRVLLPGRPADGERVAQVASTTIRGHEITLANLHITHLSGADDLRLEQLRAAIEGLNVATADVPLIVAGDFNTPVANALLRRAAEECGAFALDAWGAGGGTGVCATTPAGHRLDYISSLAASPARHPRFRESAVVLDRPGPGGGLPSDHFGVLTRIDFERS